MDTMILFSSTFLVYFDLLDISQHWSGFSAALSVLLHVGKWFISD